MNLESKTVKVNNSTETVFNYVKDLNNLQHLLPKGKYSDWEGGTDKCAFKIQGYKIALERVGETANELVKMKTTDGSPVDFDLNVIIKEDGDNATAQFACEGRVNAFLSMMIKKPLGNLFEYMGERLGKVEM